MTKQKGLKPLSASARKVLLDIYCRELANVLVRLKTTRSASIATDDLLVKTSVGALRVVLAKRINDIRRGRFT